MTLRLSWLAMVFATAMTFGRPVADVELSGRDGSENQAQVAKALASNTELAKSKAKKHLDVFEMIRDFESGERTSEVIQSEIAAVAGETRPIRWNQDSIKKSYQLTQILSHIHVPESRFEILMIHSLADKDHSDDIVTHYTDRINAAEEQSLASSMVISKTIIIENGRPVFDKGSRSQYNFSLVRQKLQNIFKRRDPVGKFTESKPDSNSLDPLAILTNENGNFNEIRDYQQEVILGGARYIVSVIPRITDLETLTVEAQIRDVDSLTSATFILVYE